MNETPLDGIKARLRALFGSWEGGDTPLQQIRAEFDAFFTPCNPPPLLPVKAGNVPAAWVGRTGTDAAVLYFHGGGYQIGSIRSHLGLMEGIGHACDVPVLGFDYRLAPEHRFPAALDDACSVYCWLLEQGIPPTRIAFAGDSAGGGLAVATMLRLRERQQPLPAAGVLLSPWLDMTASGESYTSRAALDPMTQRDKVLAMARTYLGRKGDARNPLASPLFADLRGLPPLLIHIGDHETILDNAVAFADKAQRADVPTRLQIWKNMIHHFQIFPELDETARSLRQIGAFLKETAFRPLR